MIEVNEYVRTKDGKIDKVINSNFYMSIYVECEKGLYLIENIVKHSKQLIDLIEEGDYVNGHLVEEVRISCFDSSIFVCFENIFLFFCMQFCQKFVFLFHFKKRVSSIFYPLKI